MNRVLVFMVCTLLIVPLIFPALVQVYLDSAPGKMVGTIDGWLGFLGGYVGGFLAFASAYFIYRTEKLTKERTVLHVSHIRSEVENPPQAILTSRPIEQAEPELVKVTSITFPNFSIEIKNVSSNFANEVSLNLIGNNNASIWFFNNELKQYLEYESIASLEPSKSQCFYLKIDRVLLEGIEHLDFELLSTNLFGQKNIQKIRLFLQKKGKGYAFKHI